MSKERHRGFEPLLSVWKTDVLPLNTNTALGVGINGPKPFKAF
ncbi:hypothetical protein HWB05_gp174 [Streptomyces phage BRock]|uniref:Uncharacterized protein n=1 Tax=Streptomyces phage BRock TaxID=1913591 RepID=A0A6C1FEP7_9CAUD|nr:hypothetical protein HWB05_gp174 [Streptomyces phage BRock]QIE02566.1 hypothetical protein [Streptomyces phage BRock]